MRAEVTKVRYLPLSRYAGAAVLATSVVAGVALIFFEPKSADTYLTVTTASLGTIVTFAAIVFGVWIVTLEFGSGTLQRTLTAESSRSRVLASKLVVASAAAIVVTAAAAAAGGGLAVAAARRSGVELDQGELARAAFGLIPSAVVCVCVGFAFGLLTRATGGGIALGFAFFYVLDGALTFLSAVSDYTFGAFNASLNTGITGDGSDVPHGLALGFTGVLVWILIILIPGWVWFVRGDLK